MCRFAQRRALGGAIDDLCGPDLNGVLVGGSAERRALVTAHGLARLLDTRSWCPPVTDAEALAGMGLAAEVWRTITAAGDLRLSRTEKANLLRIAVAERTATVCRRVVALGADLLGHEAAAPFIRALYSSTRRRVDLAGTEPFRPLEERYELHTADGTVLWPVAASAERLTFVVDCGGTPCVMALASDAKGELGHTGGASPPTERPVVAELLAQKAVA